MFEGWNNYDVQETRRIAREEGFAEGEAKGKAEGEVKGEAKGIYKERKEGAKRMLREGLSVELVARVSLLPVEEVRKLRKNTSLVSEDSPRYQL